MSWSDVNPAWHLYPIRVNSSVDRGEFFRVLRAENIGVNVHYIPCISTLTIASASGVVPASFR